MEFNYNSTREQGDDVNPAGYRDFLQSFNNAAGFIAYSNTGILPVDNSATFLEGTYSNMNDLITGDLTGISLATKPFGQDLITMGKVLNLETIATFGLPSNLLRTLVQNNALTQNISLAIISAGINTNILDAIIGNAIQPTIDQEQKLYAAFYLTVGQSLTDALVPLNCKTSGLTSLADLLNPIKLFPNSYATLTVPIYNITNPTPRVATPAVQTSTTTVVPDGVTIDPISWVFNNTSPPNDYYELTSTTTNNYNIGPGRCTFEFTFNSTNYFAQNPGGHFAVVVRCNNAAIANGYVQGQGIVIGNVSGTPTPTTPPLLPPGVPFAPNPAHPSTQIESFWAGVAKAPDGTLYYGNTLLANTNGANPVLLDGVEYKFTVINEIATDGKSYTGYTISQGTNIVYQQPLIYDYNIYYNPKKSGILLGHVFKNSSASPWSLTISNKTITWSPVGGSVVIITPPPPPEPTVVLPNSKVYYPIYINNGINPNLTSNGVLNQIGAQVPIGTPQISTNTPKANIVIQQPVVGFGSYLSSIVPPAQATACGAIAASFLQVKNITNAPVEKLGQIVTNLETIIGLPVNGTSVPTNLTLRNAGRPRIALGSGPQGTYTASDFFGCMSGLPYNGPLTNILARIKEVETQKLYNIYHETYLAASWARAKGWIKQNIYYVNVQPSGPRIDDWYYTITFGLETPGGGYTRGGGTAPTVSFYPNYCSASMTVTVDSNDAHLPGTFGQVIVQSKTSGGAYKYATTRVNETNAPTPPIPPEEWIRIQAPPIAMLPIQANGALSTGAVNVDGYARGSLGGVTEGIWYWPRGGYDPGMNQVLQGYIDQANAEINSINTAKRASCQSLNNSWNTTGSQLTIEQRARDYGLKPPLDTGPPVIDKSGITILPQRQNELSLYPTVVYNFVDSLTQYGLNTEPHMYAQTIENITDYSTPGGQSAVAFMRQQRNQERLTLLGIPLDNNIEDKLPYDQQKILISNGTLPTGTTNPNIPSGGVTSVTPNVFIGTNTTSNTSTTITATPITIDPIGNVIVSVPIGFYNLTDNTYVVVNPPPTIGPTGITTGTSIFPDGPIDTGLTNTPGSFGYSTYPNIVPPPLNTWYSSNTLYPSTYTVQQAIDEVIRCNCDCWQIA
jgi:hypothetical protein